MSERVFRTDESYAAEHKTRNMLANYLRSRGFQEVRDERKHHGLTESQIIYAITPDGEDLAMRVRLCWHTSKDTTSAAQLLSKIKNDNWEGTLQAKFERERSSGVTHYLIVQRDVDNIRYAALVPLSDLLRIWCAQRDISISLIARNQLGRRRKNHAMNGNSPTIWLQDDSYSDVAAALWDHAGVWDLAALEVVPPVGARTAGPNDTYADVVGIDYSLIGSDRASYIATTRSYVKRDQRVRTTVLQRAKRTCERRECGASRDYDGFLDVHHILGAAKSDRVWNCVALCPNCHREAHFAPTRNLINESLLTIASAS